MRYIKLAALVFVAVLSTAAMTQAQQMKSMKNMGDMHKMRMAMATTGKTTTLRGEVVDLACYLTKGLHGKSHEECATKCIRSGLPVGILSNGQVYVAITATHEPANSLLLPYAAKQVEVTGVVARRGGVDIVAVDKVEPVKGKWKK